MAQITGLAEFRAIVAKMNNHEYERAYIYYVEPNLTTRTAITRESIERLSKCRVVLEPTSLGWKRLADAMRSEQPINRTSPGGEVRFELIFVRKDEVADRVYLDRKYPDAPAMPIAGYVNDRKVIFSQDLPEQLDLIVEDPESAKECL